MTPSIETQIELLRKDLALMQNESRKARDEMKAEVREIRKALTSVQLQAAKWKGAFAVILGASAFVVGIGAAWDTLGKFIKGH